MDLNKDEVEKVLMQMVQKGKLACIIGDEYRWINSDNIRIKCNHCGKIVVWKWFANKKKKKGVN